MPLDRAALIIHLLVEGTGIRACQRLSGVSKSCILAILETAGQKCAKLPERKVKDLSVEYVQADEIWSYNFCKQINAKDPEHGDVYTFLAVDRKSKLIIAYHVGKRDTAGAYALLGDHTWSIEELLRS